MLGGFVKRLIGTASLDMKDFMEEDEKGNWRPIVKPVTVTSEAEVEKELKQEERQAKEAALKAAVEEAAKAAALEEQKKKEAAEKKEEVKEGKEEVKEGKEEVKVPVDSGEGVGDLGDKKGDTNPLAQTDEEKKDAATFKEKDGPSEGDKYDPAQDHEEADPEEEVPPYLKGRPIIDYELEDALFMNPFNCFRLILDKLTQD